MKKRAWLRELRGDRTQQEIADEMGINRAYYCQLENGQRGISVPLARKVASKLNIPWTYFFEDGEMD